MYEFLFLNPQFFKNKTKLFFIYWLHCTAYGILVPGQGSNLCLLHWKHRVLTTGPSGSPCWMNYQFCSIDLHVCPHSLDYYSSEVGFQIRKSWVFQLCSYPTLFRLFWSPFTSVLSSGSDCQFAQEKLVGFWVCRSTDQGVLPSW